MKAKYHVAVLDDMSAIDILEFGQECAHHGAAGLTEAWDMPGDWGWSTTALLLVDREVPPTEALAMWNAWVTDLTGDEDDPFSVEPDPIN